MEKSKKFVVLASPRTGSSMFKAALDSHPQITCHGELLRQNIRPGSNEDKMVIKQLQEEFWDRDYRQQNPLAFFENVVMISGPSEYVGFKLMLGKKKFSLIEELTKRDDYKIILLERSNLMAIYSSNEIVKVTGQGSARKNDTIQKAQVEFSAASFEDFAQRRNRQYKKVKELLKNSNKTFLSVEYNQLRNSEGLKKVLEFLGVDPNQDLEIATKKRNSDNILERFSNPEVVNTYLEEKGLQEWAVENPKVLALA